MKPLLYYSLLSNSDQYFHYYKILSRLVGQRRLSQFQVFFGKNFSVFEFFVCREIAHIIVYLKHLFLFPMGNYLTLRLIKTIVWIFDNRIQAQPQHVPSNQLPDFYSKYEYYLNICILQQSLKEPTMALQSPYVTEGEKMKISAQIAFVVQKHSNIICSGNSDMVQFWKYLELYFGKFCFNLKIQHESKQSALHK